MYSWFVVAVVFLLAPCQAYSVLHNNSVTTLYIYNSLYSNAVTIYCNDNTPKSYASISRYYMYNESLSLPSNAESKQIPNTYGNDTSFVLVLSYPTVENNGGYDCCVSYNFMNGTSVKDVCYRTTLIIKENIVTSLNGNSELRLSTKRDNYIQLVPNLVRNNSTAVNCTFNGADLPVNVKTIPPITNVSSSSDAQLVIYDTTSTNFGNYNCSIKNNNKITVASFKAIQDSIRWYPWINTTTTSSIAFNGFATTAITPLTTAKSSALPLNLFYNFLVTILMNLVTYKVPLY